MTVFFKSNDAGFFTHHPLWSSASKLQIKDCCKYAPGNTSQDFSHGALDSKITIYYEYGNLIITPQAPVEYSEVIHIME